MESTRPSITDMMMTRLIGSEQAANEAKAINSFVEKLDIETRSKKLELFTQASKIKQSLRAAFEASLSDAQAQLDAAPTPEVRTRLLNAMKTAEDDYNTQIEMINKIIA